ncbi:MAG TPA: TonB-dependent receptor, partial [Longimicrobiaceae bacterium]
GQPVASPSVAVWSRADSTLVTGAMGRPDGSFRVEGLRPGRYVLKVSSLGYTTATTQEVTLTPAAPVAEVGPVRLARSAMQLEGLTVTAERATAALAADRNTYSARELAPAGGTATDVLRSVPAVEVDAEGKVSLRGNSNVAVQLNGRAAPMRGDQLTAFLQQLPANMVERVEVIPNPSAKYDPDGMAGILNIVLKQNADLGTSGGVMAGVGSGGKYNVSGNLGYGRGPLSVFGSYGFNSDQREQTGWHFRENRFLTPSTFQRQDIDGDAEMLGHTLNGSAELKLGRRDVLSSTLLLNKRRMEVASLSAFRELDAQQAVTGRYDNLAESGMADFTADASLAFRRTLEPQRHELSAEVRVNRADYDMDNDFSREARAAAGTPASDGLPLLERNHQDALTTTLTLQADYTRPLGADTRLETGYKGTLRTLDNDFASSVFAYDRDDWESDGRGNAFRYDEAVHAGYGVLSHTAGKLSLQAGLRAERAATDFDLAGGGDRFRNDYTSLFPSALAALNLTDTRQVKASYSKRIQRPDSRLLNPFAFYEDPQNVLVGNPGLKPEYTHAFELGLQQSGTRGSLQVTPFFRRTVDAVRRTRTVDEAGVTTNTFRNLATSDSWGTDVTGSLRVGERLSGFAGFNLFKMSTDGSNVDPELSSDAVSWMGRVNASFKVSPTLDVQGMYMYRAPMNVEQGRISGFSMTSLSLRRALNPRSSLSLRVMDPFNTMGFSLRTSDDRHFQESQRRFGARAVFLTFNYNFGRPPRMRQPRPEQAPQSTDPREMGGVP